MQRSITIAGDSLFCIAKDDFRFQPMCCHYLNDSPCEDTRECTSPFGTYELSMPIDHNAPCQDSSWQITDGNCKDFDVSCKAGYTRLYDGLTLILTPGNCCSSGGVEGAGVVCSLTGWKRYHLCLVLRNDTHVGCFYLVLCV